MELVALWLANRERKEKKKERKVGVL